MIAEVKERGLLFSRGLEAHMHAEESKLQNLAA
jgi:hypothetical protein